MAARDRIDCCPRFNRLPETFERSDGSVRNHCWNRLTMAGLLLAPETRLPAPPTQLVGREGELAAIRSLLADEQVRLLTLTGPGGIGKTRLSHQIAREPGNAFPAGA